MSHPLILALFDDVSAATRAARELRSLGVAQERLSVVARSHEEEGAFARATGASPGSEIEDSRAASRLGELGAHLLAAVALVMPGIGPIVADGPLAAGLGEAAGHLAGGVARTLERTGLPHDIAEDWQARIDGGAILIGAHVATASAAEVRARLIESGAARIADGTWSD